MDLLQPLLLLRLHHVLQLRLLLRHGAAEPDPADGADAGHAADRAHAAAAAAARLLVLGIL